MSNISLCPICGSRVDGADTSYGRCFACWLRFEKFCANVPANWRKLIRNNDPSYDDWRDEQLIKRALLDGRITEQEAQRQAAELAKRIYKHYNPSIIPEHGTTITNMTSILPEYPPEKAQKF